MLSHTLLLYVVNSDPDAAGWLLFPDHQWQHPRFFHWTLSRAFDYNPFFAWDRLFEAPDQSRWALFLQASLPSWDPIPFLF